MAVDVSIASWTGLSDVLQGIVAAVVAAVVVTSAVISAMAYHTI